MGALVPAHARFLDGLSAGACITDSGGRVLHMNAAARGILASSEAGLAGKPLCQALCGRLDCGEQRGTDLCPFLRPGCAARSVVLRGVYRVPPFYRWEDDAVQPVEGRVPLSVVCSVWGTSLLHRGARRRRRLVLFVPSPGLEGGGREEDWRSMFVHDIRNALTNVLATLGLVIEDPSECIQSEGFMRLAMRSRAAVLRVSELLRTYLSLSHIDAGTYALSAQPLDLGAALRDAVDEHRAAAEAAGVALVLEAEPGLVVRADPELLPRVFGNLLGNALKFSRAAGTVRVAARALGPGLARASVADSGPGIPEAERRHVFARYYRLKGSGGSRVEGFGLGLTFCRQAVLAMGGAIEAGASPDGGAEFRVDLLREAPKRRGRPVLGPPTRAAA